MFADPPEVMMSQELISLDLSEHHLLNIRISLSVLGMHSSFILKV